MSADETPMQEPPFIALSQLQHVRKAVERFGRHPDPELDTTQHVRKTVEWFRRHPDPDNFFLLDTTIWSDPKYVEDLAVVNPRILRFVHPALRRDPRIVDRAFESCPELRDVVLKRRQEEQPPPVRPAGAVTAT